MAAGAGQAISAGDNPDEPIDPKLCGSLSHRNQKSVLGNSLTEVNPGNSSLYN
jgi:hypothetical protein